MNTTICSVHDSIISECQNFLSREIRNVEKAEPDTSSEDIADLKRAVDDYISEVNNLIYEIDLASIASLAEEAKELGQKMEDGLRGRKTIMENSYYHKEEGFTLEDKKTLEDVYQEEKNKENLCQK